MALSGTDSPVPRRCCCWTTLVRRAASDAPRRSRTCVRARSSSSSPRRAVSTEPVVVPQLACESGHDGSGRVPAKARASSSGDARGAHAPMAAGGRSLRRLPGLPKAHRSRDSARHPRAADALVGARAFTRSQQSFSPLGAAPTECRFHGEAALCLRVRGAAAARPLREPARNRRGRPHLSDSESAVPLEDRQNDADAGVEEQSSCNAGDAYQGAFGVREVTDDKAVR
jgi:hypothetical protein